MSDGKPRQSISAEWGASWSRSRRAGYFLSRRIWLRSRGCYRSPLGATIFVWRVSLDAKLGSHPHLGTWNDDRFVIMMTLDVL
ncbi:MAG: hypothetical protein ACLRSW_05555 [Christensenellaceae bacterium]